MIPATFAPMILKLIFPKLEELLKEFKQEVIEHIFKVGKIKESIDYRELPNDADMRIDKIEEQLAMLAKDSHTPAIDLKEWENIKETIRLIKRKKVFKSLNG
tara:strand:+ start:208 stop:513 length:306 start_codon:yes stop_codon:yes gene_type:complete